MQAIATDENNIAANPAGQMTEEQQRRVASAVRAEASPSMYGVSGLAIMLGFIWSLSYRAFDPPSLGYVLFGLPILAVLVIYGVMYWARAKLLGEVQAGAVELATGQVEFIAGRYRATVPGRILDLTAVTLAAGSYDFSFSPRSGWLVSAELATSDSPTRDQDELRHALAVGNHFNLDDLPYFRRGQQGPGTRRRLRHTWSTTGWLLLGAPVLLAVLLTMVSAEALVELAPLTFVIAIFQALWALGSGLGAIGRAADVWGGKLATAEGTVRKLKRHPAYPSTYFYFTLGSQSWLVSVED